MRKRVQSRLHLLSVRQVQTAVEGDHGDGGGLILRVNGNLASWVFRFTSPAGKRREMGLGPVHRGNASQAGDSLTTARDLAGEARAQLQRSVDPIDERAKAREQAKQQATAEKTAAQRTAATLARVARDYHERVIEPSRTDKHGAQWIASLENHVPPELWNGPVGAVTPPVLLDFMIDLHNEVPETATRVRQRLEAVFEDAVFRQLCTTNPAAAIRRKLREAMGRRQKGQFAALPYREAPAFMARLRQQEGIAARCLEFAMLTVARTGEAILATEPELQFYAATWVVPAERMKASEEHTVYLSDRALALAEEQLLIARPAGAPRWLFPSPMDLSRPLSNMAMLTLLGRMGMRERTTVHGLCRATFSTWANETGAGRPDVVEACLAHQEQDHVRRAYNRAQFNAERRQLLVAWAAYLEGAEAAAGAVPLLKAA